MDGAWRGSYQPSNRAIRAKILVERIEVLNAASEWTECRGELQPPLGGAKSWMAVWDDVIDFDNVGNWPMELTGWLRLLDRSADHGQHALVAERLRENLQMRHNFA